MKWTRANKVELAERVEILIAQGLRPAEIVKVIGKSDRRIRQIRKLFSLPDWARRGRLNGGKVSPQET